MTSRDPHHRPSRHAAKRGAAFFLLLPLTLSGCGGFGDLALPLTTEQGRALDRYPDRAGSINSRAERTYPRKTALAGPLPIEVIREGGAMILDNRGVHAYGPVELWLNQRYGATVETIPIGRGEPIALTSFRNRHGERYPVARFLAPDASEPLILAELVEGDQLHKLTVRLEDGWRQP